MTFESIDELARRLADSVPKGLRSVKDDLEKNFRSVLQSGLGKLDLVTRDTVFELLRWKSGSFHFDTETVVFGRDPARSMAAEQIPQGLDDHAANHPLALLRQAYGI